MKSNEIIEVLMGLLNSIPTKMLKATITFTVKNMESEYSAEVKADNVNELLLALQNAGHCNTGKWNTGYWNTGDQNTGNWNTGNRNAGDCNTGHWNAGDWNTGDQNTGDWNTGDQNTGDWNTGNRNAGDCNTGHWNAGDWNTGDFNISDFNTGCFNTETHPVYFFDKPSDATYQQWADSEAYELLSGIRVTEWIDSGSMTEQEKKEHPDHETTGGYLKKYTLKEACGVWWDALTKEEKEIVKTIPNFNPDKFYEITGIRVEE